MRISWKVYGLFFAAVASLRADCTRRRVGCAILDSENRLVSTGYNGAPSGKPGCLTDGACPRGKLTYEEMPADAPYSNCISIHAEENAVVWARRDLRGCTLYSTEPPCHQCSKTIENVGIVKVVTPEDLTGVQKAVFLTIFKWMREQATAIARHESVV